MKILALDLGTSTGWALSNSGICEAGTWELATAKNLKFAKKLRMDRRLDIRVAALVNYLNEIQARTALDWIFFEDVRFGKSLAQVQLWSAFRGALWTFAHLKGIQIDCLDTGKLKKFATGNGAAMKEQMLLCGEAQFQGEFDGLGSDAVDALWLLKWALTIVEG